MEQQQDKTKVTKRFSIAGLTNWSDNSPKVEPLNLDKVSVVLNVRNKSS